MSRPPGITDILHPPADDRPGREPGPTKTGAELAQTLFGRRPPGEAKDPRAQGRWRPA
jgi:hypothetical protein